VLEKNGMNLCDKTYENEVSKKVSLGQKIWHTTIKEAISADLFEYCESKIKKGRGFYKLENIPRYAAFGYDFCKWFSRLIGAPRNISEELAAIGALLNSYAALFDKICDDYVVFFPILVSRITRPALSSATMIVNKSQKKFFAVKEDDAPLIKMTILLMEEYFKKCEKIHGSLLNKKTRTIFKNTIFNLYESELRSVDLKFSSKFNKTEVFRILRNKSSMLIWMMALQCLLGVGANLNDGYVKLKKAILELGDVFWILDDIVDATEDFMNGKWSYLSLKFDLAYSLKNYRPGDRPLILDTMINRGAVVSSAEAMCMKYHGVEKAIEDSIKRDFDYDIIFLPWLHMWVDSLVGTAAA